MIRFLDGLALLKEVDNIEGVKYTSKELKQNFSDHVVIVRHTAYIYRDVLCDTAKAKVTDLDNCVQMGELADHIGIVKDIIRDRIDFMSKTGVYLFDHFYVCDTRFIRLDRKFKFLMNNYQPFLAGLKDADNLVHCELLGDLKIGFY